MTTLASASSADILQPDQRDTPDVKRLTGRRDGLGRGTPVGALRKAQRANSPRTAILQGVDWKAVEGAVAREQASREKHTPAISVFRWWARRPHSLMGAIIDAAQSASDPAGFTISDPFSGGGTVSIEAARRGIPTYAQDLYPWPIMGLSASLAPTTLAEFDKAAAELQQHLAPLAAHYKRRDGKMLSHIMKVRVCTCPSCSKDLYLFPEHMISKTSHRPGTTDGYFGCQGCGHVDLRALADEATPCPACGLIDRPQRRNHTAKQCVHCDHESPAADLLKTRPRWKAVLVQEVVNEPKGRRGVLLRLPKRGDPLNDSTPQPSRLALPITHGHITRRLLGVGFKTWGDLYTSRQGKFILEALDHVKRMDVTEGCRDRLAFAVIGMAEMPSHLCRWDRFHLKTFEGIANHHYAHTTFVVETNLASEIGRGTLARRVRSARKALEWWLDHTPTQAASPRHVSNGEPSNTWSPDTSLMVAIGSSVKQGLPDGSISLTLTDPPYFDDVQYGELARLFHFWLAQYENLPTYSEMEEAVPNTVRGITADDYETAIMRCLAESRRTLKADGSIILTFHNRKIAAWKALARALKGAGLQVHALAVTRAENEADHSKRDGKGMLHDLVIECRASAARGDKPVVAYAGSSQEARELLSVGLALAEAVAGADDTCLDALFQKKLKNRRLQRERIS